MSKDRSGPGQGTSVEYWITNEHRISPYGDPTKGKYLEENRTDELGDYW